MSGEPDFGYPFPHERCGDCGEPLTSNTRWIIPLLKWYVCPRCARERLDIRERLWLERTRPGLVAP